MAEFTLYRRNRNTTEMRPWVPGEDMKGVTISAEDKKAGSPKDGDMIARHASKADEKWLVSRQDFSDGYEPA
jgi:hypothetical protein